MSKSKETLVKELAELGVEASEKESGKDLEAKLDKAKADAEAKANKADDPENPGDSQDSADQDGEGKPETDPEPEPEPEKEKDEERYVVVTRDSKLPFRVYDEEDKAKEFATKCNSRAHERQQDPIYALVSVSIEAGDQIREAIKYAHKMWLRYQALPDLPENKEKREISEVKILTDQLNHKFSGEDLAKMLDFEK